MVRSLRAEPRREFIADHSTLAEPVIETTVVTGYRQLTNLHLVNLAATHGAVLATFDANLASWLAPPDRERVHLMR